MYLFFYTIYTIKINVDNFQEFSVYLDCGGTKKYFFCMTFSWLWIQNYDSVNSSG